MLLRGWIINNERTIQSSGRGESPYLSDNGEEEILSQSKCLQEPILPDTQQSKTPIQTCCKGPGQTDNQEDEDEDYKQFLEWISYHL